MINLFSVMFFLTLDMNLGVYMYYEAHNSPIEIHGVLLIFL